MPSPTPRDSRRDDWYPNLLIVIGASAGGLDPLIKLLERLPDDLQATVLVATHRPPDATENVLASVLSRYADLHIEEPQDGDALHCATILIGAPNEVITIDGAEVGIAQLTRRSMRLQRIDALFASAAEAAGPNAVGVVLSGLLWDGVAGLEEIEAAGGRCLIQDPLDASYASMPQHALRAVHADRVGTAEELAAAIIDIAAGRQCEPVD